MSEYTIFNELSTVLKYPSIVLKRICNSIKFCSEFISLIFKGLGFLLFLLSFNSYFLFFKTGKWRNDKWVEEERNRKTYNLYNLYHGKIFLT